jgi:phosphatidylserine/phosphatidylglycerophosphate/cardiolipin synthase-like enzyme
MSNKITVRFINNNDDVFIAWDVDGDGIIPNCVGFAIQRELTRGSEVSTEWLRNRVGFADQPAKKGETRSSEEWPFQRYTWTDHDVTIADVVRYQLSPVLTDAAGNLTTRTDLGTGWSAPLTISESVDDSTSAYFNRALSASQFVSRYLKDHKLSQKQLADEVQQHESSLRSFMGGQLLSKLKSVLEGAATTKTRQVYGSLFELRDQELIDRLVAIGPRAHIVLADGSPKATNTDPNNDARSALKKAKVEVIDRKVAWDATKNKKTGALSHNKFLVFVEGKQPSAVWTGSTNWTPSGLCTQVNNSILIKSPELATLYFEQWNRLAAAKSKLPNTLAGTNAAPAHFQQNTVPCEAWFTPDKAQVDLKELQKIVQGAQQGVLFLMFMPGSKPLGDIVSKSVGGLYVRGVTNQYVSSAQSAIKLFTKGQPDEFQDHAPNPQGIKQEFAYWLDEVQLNTLGVLIHSKLILVDPFGDNPVLVVGSHNFSGNASGANDENFLVLRNQPALARAYAANIISVYQHYRWRYYVAKHKDPWHKLSNDPVWQKSYQSPDEKLERAFWLKA